jgi:epoxyqueuosine reductase
VTSERGAQIIEKAKEMGATLAGIASVELLKKSPAHRMTSRFGTKIDGVYSIDETKDLHEIKYPSNACSALIIALSHPQNKPELDWSFASGGTQGNLVLVRITQELSAWIQGTLGIKTHKLNYFVELGGTFLKDAAVLAGLGCIGRNNILITPELGPRVRLRALLLEAELTPTGPIVFDPCVNCEGFCRKACPQNAFYQMAHSYVETGISDLPGRDGFFSRARCMNQINRDVEDSKAAVDETFYAGLDSSGVEREGKSRTDERIKWCRRCELTCPIGT